MGLTSFATLGYLSSSVVFNSLNTIVFGLLYPKFSHECDPDYSNHFSIANVITQVLSALLMPLLGSAADETRNAKGSMLLSSAAGILATFSFIPIRLWNPAFQPGFLAVVFVLAMFLLRISALNQNTLLGQFSRENRTTYSLGANLIGFVVNLVGLGILTLASDTMQNMWWIAVFASVASIAWFGSLFAPSQRDESGNSTSLLKQDEESTNTTGLNQREPGFCKVLMLSFARVRTTVLSLYTLELRAPLLFLLAYLFFSVGGTSFSVFISVYFANNFTGGNTSDSRIEQVNFFFKLAMVFGVLVGMGLDRWLLSKNKGSSKTDTLLLVAQSAIFSIGYVCLWSSQRLGWGYEGALASSLVIGSNYGWNMSVSRSVMSRLAPVDKLGELMGFFSTVTYAAMALVSLILVIVGYALPDSTLPLDVVLFTFVLPGYIFLLLLYRHLDDVEKLSRSGTS